MKQAIKLSSWEISNNKHLQCKCRDAWFKMQRVLHCVHTAKQLADFRVPWHTDLQIDDQRYDQLVTMLANS